jgi:hypothetical protein
VSRARIKVADQNSLNMPAVVKVPFAPTPSRPVIVLAGTKRNVPELAAVGSSPRLVTVSVTVLAADRSTARMRLT